MTCSSVVVLLSILYHWYLCPVSLLCFPPRSTSLATSTAPTSGIISCSVSCQTNIQTDMAVYADVFNQPLVWLTHQWPVLSPSHKLLDTCHFTHNCAPETGLVIKDAEHPSNTRPCHRLLIVPIWNVFGILYVTSSVKPNYTKNTSVLMSYDCIAVLVFSRVLGTGELTSSSQTSVQLIFQCVQQSKDVRWCWCSVRPPGHVSQDTEAWQTNC